LTLDALGLQEISDPNATSKTWPFALLRRGATAESYSAFYEAKGLRSYWLRSLLAPISAARWRRYITALHARVGAQPPWARVLAKPLRSYLRQGLAPRKRVAILIETYDWLQARFSPAILKRLCDNESLELVTLEARKGSRYTVFLTTAVNVALQREGELGLFIAKSATDVMLCRLAMTFTQINGRVVLAIGGLQGPPSANKRDVIDATRELHGLRPKDAALLAARAFAQSLGLEEAHAVSDANHVLNRLQDTAKFSNYDGYWQERGATAGGPFGYVFPALQTGEPEDANKRGAIKQAIVAASQEFVKNNGQ